jgi:hypothetical protein
MARYVNVDPNGTASQTVDAVQLQHPMTLYLSDTHTEEGAIGDFLVTFPRGVQGIVGNHTFLRCYREPKADDIQRMVVSAVQDAVAAALAERFGPKPGNPRDRFFPVGGMLAERDATMPATGDFTLYQGEPR